MIARLFERFVVRRPWIPILGCLLLLAASAVQLPDFRLDADSDSLTLENDPQRDLYKATRAIFGSDDYVIVATAPPDPWSDASLRRIDALTKALEGLDTVDVPGWGPRPAIDRVLSPTNQRLFRSLVDGHSPMEAMQQPFTLLDEAVDRDKARAELTTSALFAGNLLSPEGDAFAIIAYFADGREGEARGRWKELSADPGADPAAVEDAYREYRLRSDEEQARVRAIVARIRVMDEEYGVPGAPVYASGVPTIVVDMVNAIEDDIVLFGIFVVGFMILVMGAFLRRLRWVLLPLAAVAVVVAVVVAATVLAGKKTTVVTSNLSSLMLIVGLAHAIHIAVQSREVRRAHPDFDRREVVLRTMRGIALPCLYAGLTTAVGFASIAVSDIRPCIDFGIFMSIGTVFAWVVSFTLIPALMMLLPLEKVSPAPPPSERPWMPRLARWVLAHPWPVIGGGVLMLAMAIAGILRLDVETRFTDYFRESNPIAQGLGFIDRRIGGTTPLEVILHGDEKDYFLKEENFARIEAAHARLATLDSAGTVLSLASLRTEGDKILGTAMPLPEGQRMPVVMLLNFARMQMGAEALRDLEGDYVTKDYSTARLQVRIRETSPTLSRQELLAGLRADLAADPVFDPVAPDVTGMFVLYTNMLQSLTTSQEQTLVLVIAALWFMFVILFRNLRVATLAMLPNLIPILFTLGAMGMAGIPLDMMTIMIASVSMGMAVDATLHYTHRYLHEVRSGVPPDRAIEICHGSIGTAVLFTDLTVAGGFWVLVFSNFKPTIYFGLFTSLATLTAIAAALVLLPVLLRRWGGVTART